MITVALWVSALRALRSHELLAQGIRYMRSHVSVQGSVLRASTARIKHVLCPRALTCIEPLENGRTAAIDPSRGVPKLTEALASRPMLAG